MIKKIIKILVVLTFIFFTICSVWYLWFRVYPRYLIRGPIEKFENSFYNDKSEDYIKYMDSNSAHAHLIKTNLKRARDLFLLFEKGFKISYAHRIYVDDPEEPNCNHTIWAEISKIANRDGKYRDHFEVRQVKIEGEWKIHTYYFPDFIDYQ